MIVGQLGAEHMLTAKKIAKTSRSIIGQIVLLHNYSRKNFRLVKITQQAMAEVLVERNCLSQIKVYCAANGIKCPKPIIDFSQIIVMYPE